jgi:hypothetical protein
MGKVSAYCRDRAGDNGFLDSLIAKRWHNRQISKTVFIKSLMKIGKIPSVTLMFVFDLRDCPTDGRKQFTKRISSKTQTFVS